MVTVEKMNLFLKNGRTFARKGCGWGIMAEPVQIKDLNRLCRYMRLLLIECMYVVLISV